MNFASSMGVTGSVFAFPAEAIARKNTGKLKGRVFKILDIRQQKQWSLRDNR